MVTLITSGYDLSSDYLQAICRSRNLRHDIVQCLEDGEERQLVW